MSKKRKYDRIPATILAELYPIGSIVSQGRGCVVNLSLGGVAIETETSFAVGTELDLVINLPLQMTGRIVRSEKVEGNFNRYGIEFTKSNLLDRLRIRRYIRNWIRFHGRNR